MQKIDKTNPFFDNIPTTLDGEVLVERTPHGVITVTEENLHFIKQATPLQRMRQGWDKYEAELLNYDTSHVVLPEPATYKQDLLNLISSVAADIDSPQDIASLVAVVQSANDSNTLMKLRHSLDDIAVASNKVLTIHAKMQSMPMKNKFGV